MNLLEDMYAEVRLNEKLADINVSSERIQSQLEKEYAAYRARIGKLHPHKKINFPNQQNDEAVVKRVLSLVQDQDTSFTYIFNNFIKTGDKNKLKMGIGVADQRWKHNILNRELGWDFKNQPLNLAIFNIMKKVGLTNFPVKMNSEGWPTYPKHLLNKYVAMNILEQMIRDKQITPEQKDFIDNVLFDDNTKSLIQGDIDEHRKRTAAFPDNYPQDVNTGTVDASETSVSPTMEPSLVK